MDIDIDVAKNVKISELFPQSTPASQIESGKIKKHLVGYHFQNVPKDHITELCAIPYTKIDDFDIYKIDFLHLSLLDNFRNKEHLLEVLHKPVDWTMLEDQTIVENLFHISKHFDLVSKIKPTNIETLADILALIRPNKITLIPQYIKNRKSVLSVLYTKIDNSDLRKSHAIAYATNITLHMNLLKYKL